MFFFFKESIFVEDSRASMDSDEEEYMLDAFADGSRDQARLDLTGGEFSFSFFFFFLFFLLLLLFWLHSGCGRRQRVLDDFYSSTCAEQTVVLTVFVS
jgi:hypothetical protein